jgi:hypothetical protein
MKNLKTLLKYMLARLTVGLIVGATSLGLSIFKIYQQIYTSPPLIWFYVLDRFLYPILIWHSERVYIKLDLLLKWLIKRFENLVVDQKIEGIQVHKEKKDVKRYINSPIFNKSKSPLGPYGTKWYYSTSRLYSTAGGPTKIKKNNWIVYNDPAEFMALNSKTIRTFLENFFKDIISPCKPGQFFYLIFKVRFVANTEEDYGLEDWRWEDGGPVRNDYITKSFSNIQRLEHDPNLQEEKIKKLLSVIMWNVNNKSDNYDDLFIHNFFIMYKLIDPIYSPEGVVINNPTPIKSKNPLTRSDINKLELIDLEAKGIKPTMDIETWNDKIKFSNDLPASFGRTAEDELFYTFDISDSYYICEVVDSKNNLILKFRDSLSKDIFSQGGLDTFKREILKNNQEGEEIVVKTYKYVDGKLKYWMVPVNSRFITNPNLKPKNITDTGKRKYSTGATSDKRLTTSNLGGVKCQLC